MGCDIHATLIERRTFRDGTPWTVTLADKVLHERNYRLFALLADVRNDGSITPLVQPRGLPDWFTSDHLGDDCREHEVCSGDHSHSWLSMAELRRAADNYPPYPEGDDSTPKALRALADYGEAMAGDDAFLVFSFDN